MSTPPLGMMTVPHYEWWLHNNPFKRQEHSCPICCSDTGCFSGCPSGEIKTRLDDINYLMKKWTNRKKDEIEKIVYMHDAANKIKEIRDDSIPKRCEHVKWSTTENWWCYDCVMKLVDRINGIDK